MLIHTVTQGDTVYSISKQYGIPESRIITDNYLDPSKKLVIGQTLIISRPCKTCAVRGGETLKDIADTNNVSVLSLLQNNPQIIAEKLRPSQTLNVNYDREDPKNIIVSAYTGNATSEQIEKALPYISMLHVQNKAHISGSELKVLNGTAPIVSLAKQYRAMPILSFECADERGRWRSECVNTILESPDSTEKFIQSALKAVKDNGFSGLEMQFCCKNDPARYKLHDMLLAISGIFNENNLTFIIPHLPEVTSDDNAETFIDIADLVPLWNYIWDDEMTASPAAPINKITELLEAPILQPHLRKMLLGIPTFGVAYSPAQGGYRKNIIDASGGLGITQNYPVSSEFDAVTQTPYINFSERSRHGASNNIIHYEDARSYLEKLNLINKYNLAGVNIMSLDYAAPVFWQILNQHFTIAKY